MRSVEHALVRFSSQTGLEKLKLGRNSYDVQSGGLKSVSRFD